MTLFQSRLHYSRINPDRKLQFGKILTKQYRCDATDTFHSHCADNGTQTEVFV